MQFCQFVLNFISRPTYYILFDFFLGANFEINQKKKGVVKGIKDKYIQSGLKYILCRSHRKKELKTNAWIGPQLFLGNHRQKIN